MTIVVVGAGGIGGCAAAELQRAGEHVTIVDSNRDHVEAIRSGGLRVGGIRGEYRVTLDAILPEQWREPADLVLFAVKSQHTEPAIRATLPHLHDDSTVVSMQNGWNALRVAEVVGAERTVAAMLHIVGNYEAPGHVTRHTEGVVYIGEMDGSTSTRTDKLAERLSPAFSTESVHNVWGYIWSKQIYGATMPVNALVDLPAREIYSHDWVRGILLAVMAEALEAAIAEGVEVEPYDRFDPAAFALEPGPRDCGSIMANLPKGSAKGNSGVWHDIKRRRKTEVDHLSGELVRIGQRHGLPMSVNAGVVRMIAEIDSGTRDMSWDNLHELARPAHEYLSRHPGLADCAPQLRRVLDRRVNVAEAS